ncbi:hypothetical protein [Nocardiopsis sp. CC223A]|uniref:hypothetical protein n=1 Tax=Nocardiopsis sp. CC223A TaxID=3044051 RepID=UPI00278C8872|nr:hypothetical protein [Nocardiopsis sp. CC223A]
MRPQYRDRFHPYSHPSDRRGALRRIRRYSVPRTMIERATEHRLAGDGPVGLAPAPEGVLRRDGFADPASWEELPAEL